MTDRRAFIGAVAAGMIAAPLAVRAQAPARVHRIGWLVLGDPLPLAELELRYAALRERGWIDGQNLLIEQRHGSNRAELLQHGAEELVRFKPELIVTEGTAATQAVRNATSSIPIVMYAAGDPVGAGLVASLAKPAGNITGFSLVSPELDSKRLSLLRELLPATQSVGELEDSNNPYYRAARTGLERTYRSLGIQPIILEVARASELEAVIADLARKRVHALHVPRDALFIDNRHAIIAAALKHALPTLVDGNDLLEVGGLLSYDYNEVEQRRRGVAFIDKILRGAKPADLPIEQPTKFDLGINLKTAKALGINVPQSLVLRADVVIQ